MIATVTLVLGLSILVKGADLLVDGASAIARKFGVTPLVIGLTVVAFGTSLPELIVNLFAAFQGNVDIAIGNILGSNISNILLILGVSALIMPLKVGKGTVWREIPFSFLAVILMGVMVADKFLDGMPANALTRTDGLALLLFFIIFLYYSYSISKNADDLGEDVSDEKLSTPIASGLVLLGLGMLTLGGKAVVDGAVTLAYSFGLSEAIVGLTIVAIGTSLPELVTSAVATYKGSVDIAVGNVVGSNIFNLFWVLGLSSVIQPLPFADILLRDVGMTIFATGLLFAVMFIGKRHHLERWQGAGFIILYILYLAVLVVGEM